uniref:Armadillo repeat-containing protein 8 n=1 Tax=Eucampia antarctica TaxID=49252 RepID=A0A7S2RWH6_9STRA|mmetsp:Transcript_27797/g.26598  ORF Transcript_27797/g.26598 Transcript_27797/m.26598 type:complete len:111 (+) Transcript_27797:72-404(+)
MQAHVSDAIVQEVACAALRNIVKVGGAERATVLASVSGFTAIQNAMGAHPNEVQVQKEACQALLELTALSADANLLDLLGGHLQSLLEATNVRYPAECKECACIILMRLS